MTLLLDTHIWVWSLLSPQKISLRVQREMASPNNEVYLSPISIWEAHLMVARKRIRLKKSFPEWLSQSFEVTPVREAPFNFAVAAETSRIELPQRDLGDLFLAATASLFGYTLVTEDEQLLACRWLKTLAN